MREFVHLVILACVVPWCNLGTASGYYEHPRKLPKYRDVATLNSSSGLSGGMSKSDDATYFALYKTFGIAATYFGATATFDVQGFPDIKDTEASSGKIWIQNYDNKDASTLNSLQAGWQIKPSVYGDSKTHFFIYWTADAGKTTGCFDLKCVGFVPVNGAPITPGDTLEPANGQKKISAKIFKNKDDGDWWLYYGSEINNLRPVGYWPKSLFTNMQYHASQIGWGGVTHANSKESSPPMGNGQWPGETSASVQNIQYVDSRGQVSAPTGWILSLGAFAPNKKCYQVSPIEGNKFYYGGPGGCKN
ncbi:hypothetical protein EJB05_33683 [Eragrostis curvula]|uniref:Neprosin PEP catalytic domain-containing protein n=1 Tax=Eragrostis curvula TaxID=38414 RepID=A0A5J9U258_9POAL|nr:hypothetical protein EJB05_33683 [Eragrostis curvula]